MTHNDILRRIRYILDARDNKIAAIFAKADHTVTTEQVNRWLKREEEDGYATLSAHELTLFLDGLIIDQRGPKDGPQVKYIQAMSNNLILMKLKIAFNLKSEDMLDLMKLAGFQISKHELSALFRKKDHKHYRVCKNQILRKFMKGLQIKCRGHNAAKKPIPSATTEPKTTRKTVTKTLTKTAAKTQSKPAPKTTTKTTDETPPSKAASIWQKSLKKAPKGD
ncbi:DUF1456 family protein [Marinicella sp. S1101]|uniref:DUF1456 family protein n=1 Tax=Marinicella marina TaxID=2996016 RepID=UPI002260F095|nr:DUF1456 family protein [Marinicella marina]MCX7552734.1 DUF1456 family protein [Marinicella marina]MDJ1139957.1 DUF1456 family protein [Marinicella marina]